MTVERLIGVNEDIVADINRVNAQLHDDGRVGTIEDIRTIVRDPNIALVAVKDGERVVGLATLYIMPKIGKRSSYIEDVVVDEAYRGKGLGEQLVRKVVAIARENGVEQIYLTSRPVHAAAHHLYKKVGFEVKDTTVFRLKL